MRHQGTARLDKKTKNLVKRLSRDDIAIIDHADMDRVSAEALLETGVEVVVNAAESISGAYPNAGPLLLTRGGVTLIDRVGPAIFDAVSEGEPIEVVDGDVLRGGEVIARGERMTVSALEAKMEEAKAALGERLDEFARNTLHYLEQEKDLLTDDMWIPDTRIPMYGRQALIVVRGYDYREDLEALAPYIREMKPVLIAVDGGADALRERGFEPDVILGDMDSVSDEALKSGAQLIVHAYPDGRAPGMKRIEGLGLTGQAWPLSATSEDLALLLAYESGADLLVAVGTHASLEEYLDKGRGGMASSFLVRLKVGTKLVDAKGVNKLYRSSAGPRDLMFIVAAALAVVTALIAVSPAARFALDLLVLRLRTWFGI